MTKRKDPADYVKRGRPTKYTPALGRAIAEAWTLGKSRDAICRTLSISYESISEWERVNPEFADAMVVAREEKAHRFADQVVEIADDNSTDWVEFETKAGNKRREPNHELVQRSRLRTDVRLKLMAMWAPKIYGQASRLELTGAGGGPILLEQITLVAMRELEAERLSAKHESQVIDVEREKHEGQALTHTPTHKQEPR
jgi:hypothetical protein